MDIHEMVNGRKQDLYYSGPIPSSYNGFCEFNELQSFKDASLDQIQLI